MVLLNRIVNPRGFLKVAFFRVSAVSASSVAPGSPIKFIVGINVGNYKDVFTLFKPAVNVYGAPKLAFSRFLGCDFGRFFLVPIIFTV